MEKWVGLGPSIIQLIQRGISILPGSHYWQARMISSDPEAASHLYLRFLRQSEGNKGEKVVRAINFLIGHTMMRSDIPLEALNLHGQADLSSGQIFLSDVPEDGRHSSAYIPSELGGLGLASGKSLVWALRCTARIEDGQEFKASIGDLTFAVVNHAHSGGQSNFFRWSRETQGYVEQLNAGPPASMGNKSFQFTLFLWDDQVWCLVDDTIILAGRITGKDREEWRRAPIRLSTYKSAKVAVHSISIFTRNG